MLKCTGRVSRTRLKITKGVICKIVPDDDMPVNGMGVRAEVVMDPAGRMNRMIPGSPYEHYIASTCVQVRQDLGKMLGETIYPEVIMDEHGGSPKAQRAVHLEQLVRTSEPELIEKMWAHLMSLYELFAPIQYDNYLDLPFEARVDILVGAVTDNIQLLMPTNNPIWVPAAMLHAEARFAPEYGKVSYRGNSTRLSITDRDVRIAPIDYILLDKTADSGSAVSSGRQQIHGVLTQTTSNEKYSSPVRNNSTRLTGETEMRIIASTTLPETAPELLDRNANPLVHEVITEGLMTHPTPADVESLVDRSRYPLGYSRPLQIVRHIARCAGWTFRASKYKELCPKPRDFK